MCCAAGDRVSIILAVDQLVAVPEVDARSGESGVETECAAVAEVSDGKPLACGECAEPGGHSAVGVRTGQHQSVGPLPNGGGNTLTLAVEGPCSPRSKGRSGVR